MIDHNCLTNTQRSDLLAPLPKCIIQYYSETFHFASQTNFKNQHILFFTFLAAIASLQRRFLALRRITLQSREIMSHLLLLSTEKDLLAELHQIPNFYALVFEKFTSVRFK